jgi:hypothetical protein
MPTDRLDGAIFQAASDNIAFLIPYFIGVHLLRLTRLNHLFRVGRFTILAERIHPFLHALDSGDRGVITV